MGRRGSLEAYIQICWQSHHGYVSNGMIHTGAIGIDYGLVPSIGCLYKGREGRGGIAAFLPWHICTDQYITVA